VTWKRLAGAVCVMAAAGAGPAFGDVILPTDLSAADPGAGVVGFPAFRPAPMNTLTPVQLRRYLTFLQSAVDVDKDGFVDEDKVHASNPNGYVVFHFRTQWGNERVTLGMPTGTLLRAHLRHRAPEEVNSRPRRVPAAPLSIPEPTVLLLLSGGLVVCLRRRRLSPAPRPASS